jgi:hypothetical protein
MNPAHRTAVSRLARQTDGAAHRPSNHGLALVDHHFAPDIRRPADPARHRDDDAIGISGVRARLAF